MEMKSCCQQREFSRMGSTVQTGTSVFLRCSGF